MPGKHHFVSYSPHEALDFVLQLTDALETGSPPQRVWLDKRNLRPGNWDMQITEAIRTCESLLFIMTHDSVQDNSVCKEEWTLALRYKKPIIPLKLHPDSRQTCREEAGRLERFPRWLLSVWGRTSRLISSGEGDHVHSSTDPASRGDGSHVLPAWRLCAGDPLARPGADRAGVGGDRRLWLPPAARPPR